jgi:glycosyltransferase involved in cell wall biosynthesis
MTAAPRAPVVGYVLPWEEFGGGEMATLRMARALAERRRCRPVALCRASPTIVRAFEAASIETVPFTPAEFSYRRGWPYFRSVGRMVRTIRSHQIDLVHCSDLMGAYQAAFAARVARVPVVCHVRSSFPPDEIPLHHKLPLAAVDHFLFVSRAVWRNFDRIRRVGADRGTVVYDAAPSQDPTSADDPARLRREIGLPEHAPVIGMVARIAPEKDFETLVAAMRSVVRERPDARLLLVGACQDAAYAARLRQLVQAMGLGERVSWTGFRRDVAALMRAMDIVVLATHTEGFSLVILEAMEQCRPVVATRVGGVPEIVSDGENGLLHERQDADGLARAILRLLADRPFADELARRGHMFARAQFTMDRTLDAVTGVYDRFLHRPFATAMRMTAEV